MIIMRHMAVLGGFGLALALTLAASAQTALMLAPGDYLADSLLPAPPADGSPKALAELEEVRRIERERTPAQLARADYDDRTEDVSIFAEAMGPAFDLARLPATAKLFAEVRAEEKAAAKAAKDHFLRNRPWIVAPELKSCAKEDAPKSSYPSGHATMGFSMAAILAQLSPQHAAAVMARAGEYADNRLVCGMHFRSDVVAGQTLGVAVALKLREKAAFNADFDAAAKELRAAGL